MARPRKTLKPEIMPPGSDQPKTKIVNAKHKIEYDAPVTVPVEIEESPEDDLIFDIDPAEDAERRRKRKTAKDEREDLRRDMDKIGVAPMTRLRLTIEKYIHGDSLDAGVTGDKAYCTKYTVTKDHILSDDFLDVARKYGPGRYWFTLRLDNKVVRQWDRMIDSPQSGQVMQRVNPDDPTSPQISIHMPENGAAPLASDPFKEAEKALSLVEKYNKAFGRLQPEQNNTPQRSEDEILAGALLSQPAMVENVVGSLVKRFGKGSGGADDDPSWTGVAMEAIKTGQATTIIQTIIREIVAPFRNWGNNNGQTQMGQAPLQNHGAENQNQSNQSPAHVHAIQDAQTQPQGATDMAQAGAHTNGDGQQQVTPEQQALTLVVEHCQRKFPPRLTFQELIQMEQRLDLLLNQHAMQTGQLIGNRITGYLDLLANTPVDDVLAFVKTLPNGEQVASLPHAKAWTEDLQKLIKESQTEGDEKE
jgi:hypothetical protein